MTALNAQLGVVDEVTYGTPVTVTRFYETEEVPLPELQQERAESMAVRASQRVQRSDRHIPYRKGASISPTLAVPTKGFGWWLKHMLGTSATGSVTDSNYTHTGSIGSLTGDFFTTQVGVPLHPSGTVQPFTLHGCKIASWELSCDLDGLLMFTPTIDAEDMDTSTGLATASYASGALVFGFVGATITIAATTVPVKNFKVACDNRLNLDRRFLRGSSLKYEPTETAGFREITWEAEAEFDALTQFNRFSATLASDTVAAITATFQGPVAHAGSTLPSLVVTIPAARFDAVDLSDSDGVMQGLSGKALYDGTNSAITIAYTSPDATA